MQHGWALEYAGDDMFADREIMMHAVKHDWNALQYADDELKCDREIVIAAVTEDGKALEHADADMWEDKEVILLAVSNFTPHSSQAADFGSASMFSHILEYMPDSIRRDRDVALAAVQQVGPTHHALNDPTIDEFLAISTLSSLTKTVHAASNALPWSICTQPREPLLVRTNLLPHVTPLSRRSMERLSSL